MKSKQNLNNLKNENYALKRLNIQKFRVIIKRMTFCIIMLYERQSIFMGKPILFQVIEERTGGIMLELKNIKKEYVTGEEKVMALKGISMRFRENEFVSILGPSGCGKTTMLNIIGGLDQYTSGDLIINGRTTKDFKDRDWDTYRNHSIGFVFQSYNLIPHQTVLSNVELALTLSGVSKDERRQRAIQVLEEVGLEDQIYKKPNQMSGGQMQRVAIARALINNPDILLADEPTGALDSTTSVQIMELLKVIAKDKLVIMVTHNPELAKEYSTRIIRLKDGETIDDSDPVKGELLGASVQDGDVKKTFMSFFTALSLSLNNLITKKGRTILTAFAGSIGIIGIALIMSLSNGVKDYISKVEEDTLSSYPITIEDSSLDMSAMIGAMSGASETDASVEEGMIRSSAMMNDLLETLSTKQSSNNLEAFKAYLESGESIIPDVSSAIQYGYNLNINIYNENAEQGIVQVNPNQIMDKIGFSNMMSSEGSSSFMSGGLMSYDVWEELLDNQALLETQYDVVTGQWPTAYNEVVLMVDEKNTISDYTLYSLGLLNQDDLAQNVAALFRGEAVTTKETKSYTYDELVGMTFKLILNTDYFVKENGIWVDNSTDEEGLKEIVANGKDIKVVGIIRPNEEAVTTSTTGAIGYTSALKEYIINAINESEIAKEQIGNPEINVFTGMKFPETTAAEFDYNALTEEEKAYMATLSEEEMAEMLAAYQSNSGASYESNKAILGIVNLDNPSSINIYPKNFEAKETIEDDITAYNDKQTANGYEENVITYSDLVGVMMRSITSIIDIISYVLMAFVSVSLIVSSIMIGIITYISVLERTKEIGILRSIGASKKDISRVFNAETFIIGLFSGTLGIIITLLLNIPINMIVKSAVGVSGISSLPGSGGLGLILISLGLTVVAGLIPSKMASKRDPVEALRSE